MYKIEINEKKKEMVVKGMGIYKEDELSAFISEFKRKSKSLRTPDYTLILDTKSLSTAQQDQVPTMSKIMDLYFSTPFKERFYVKPDSKVAGMQMKRITENENYKTLQILETF